MPPNTMQITDAPRDRDWDALYHRYTLDSFKSQVTDVRIRC